MSATRDKTQKITFVYSNLYEIYRKGVERARNSDSAPQATVTHSGAVTSVVIKAGQSPGLRTSAAAPVVNPYTPAELIGKRVAKPAVIQAPQVARELPVSPVEELKANLKTLNDLQSRLRVMLRELEELVKE